jgi:hypothetical protein
MPYVNAQSTQSAIAEQIKWEYQRLGDGKFDLIQNISQIRKLLQRCPDLFDDEAAVTGFMTENTPAMPVGSHVFWNDPDNGVCSGYGIVAHIDDSEGVFSINKMDGGHVQTLRHELEAVQLEQARSHI